MFLKTYRSPKFEFNSAMSYYEYGTFLVDVRPDYVNHSRAVNRDWSFKAESPTRAREVELESFDDWRPIRVYDIGRKPLFISGHSGFYSTFKNSQLGLKLGDHLRDRGTCSGKDAARRHTLADHLSTVFCLKEQDVQTIARLYLFPTGSKELGDAQVRMEDAMDYRLKRLMDTLEYRCIDCTEDYMVH